MTHLVRQDNNTDTADVSQPGVTYSYEDQVREEQ